MGRIDKIYRRLATFPTVNDSRKVIMDGTNTRDRHRINIFYNISGNELDWKQK